MTRKVFSVRGFVILTFAFVAISGPSLLADGGANHRTRNLNFGVSGGNVNDRSRAFCCSGTLGALLQAGTNKYVLSNNHVLGRSDQAVAGEDISQPGLIDNNCRVSTVVADFTTAPPLGSNVDAAIAQLRPGLMNSDGDIQDIGPISSSIKTPTVGLAVAKSGRTTGLTTGSISSVNTSVSVQYQKGCGGGKKFVVSYTGQVVVSGSSFSAGGDSGSVIVSTGGSCPQPVALLFAGSSTTTIGNPISQVLTQVSNALGSAVSFVGTCVGPNSEALISDDNQVAGPSREAIETATEAMRTQEARLMSRPGIIGIGVGASDTGSNEATIVVYVDANYPTAVRVPRRINGVRVKRVFTDPIVAY